MRHRTLDLLFAFLILAATAQAGPRPVPQTIPFTGGPDAYQGNIRRLRGDA